MNKNGDNNTGMGKKSKSSKTFIITEISLILLCFAAVFILVITFMNMRDGKKTALPVLENKIREVQELATVRQVYRDVIYTKVGSVFNSEILFSIDYNIIAGINLSTGIQLEQREDGSILIQLPEPQILSIDADDSSINQIYIRENLRTVKQSDYMGLIIAEKESLSKAAVNSGILNRAKINSETIIRRIFHLSGYDNVHFRYQTPLEGGRDES